MYKHSKFAFLRAILLKSVPALLLILAGLIGGAYAGESFTDDPFVPKDPIMPLAEVSPGMRGKCFTVIRGVDVVSFDLEVVDILGTLGNPNNLILVKASGPVAEAAGGIASGMSGSPFYIDGKLVGAIGYGWSFTDNFHGLVTPIEDMLEIWNNPEIIPSFDLAPMIAETPPTEDLKFSERWSRLLTDDEITDDEDADVSDDDGSTDNGGEIYEDAAYEDSAEDELPDGVVIEEEEVVTPSFDLSIDISADDIIASWDLLVSRDRRPSRGGDTEDNGGNTDESLQTVFISGLSERMASEITEILGVQPAPFGGSSERAAKEIRYDPEIEPGMAIGASLMWGDVEISSIGTLTAVSNDGRFIGYGHPLLRMGPTAAVLTEAHISTVIPSLQSSFKVGSTRDIIGIITQDRPQGIGGRIGQFAPAASVNIDLTDVDSGRSYRRAFQMVQDKFLLANLASPAIVGSVENLWGRAGGGSAKITATFSGSALRDGWTRTNIFVSETDVARQMLAEFTLLTQMFAVNPFQEIRPFGVNVEVEVTQEPRVLYIEDVKVEQNDSLKPGDTVSFDITLRPWRRDPFVRTYTLTVPDNISGIAQLLVRGGGIAEESPEYRDQAWRAITSLPMLLSELDALETNDQIIMEIRGQESLRSQIARARDGGPDELINDQLKSEIREEKMLEGSMRVVRTNYYVGGIIHRLIRIDGDASGDDFESDEEWYLFYDEEYEDYEDDTDDADDYDIEDIEE